MLGRPKNTECVSIICQMLIKSLTNDRPWSIGNSRNALHTIFIIRKVGFASWWVCDINYSPSVYILNPIAIPSKSISCIMSDWQVKRSLMTKWNWPSRIDMRSLVWIRICLSRGYFQGTRRCSWLHLRRLTLIDNGPTTSWSSMR